MMYVCVLYCVVFDLEKGVVNVEYSRPSEGWRSCLYAMYCGVHGRCDESHFIFPQEEEQWWW